MAERPQRLATLVDTNVLLDVLIPDETWGRRSAQALAEALDAGPVVINPIIYAEVSAGFERVEELEAALPPDDFAREPLPFSAGFLAGKAYLAYRRAGGTRLSPLPDFYIGAHAATLGYHLLTRDAARYRTYFPRLQVVSP